MLLPGFQNFPAKCPKSEIFLRDFPASRQKKKTIVRGQFLREAPFPLVRAFEPYSPVRPFGSFVRNKNNHFFSTVFWGGDMKKRAIYRRRFRALEILGFSSFKKKDAQKLD